MKNAKKLLREGENIRHNRHFGGRMTHADWLRANSVSIEEYYETHDDKFANTGEYLAWLDAPTDFLTDEEHEYLKEVISPFWWKVQGVAKRLGGSGQEYIEITIKNDEDLAFPNFVKGTMYKGMTLERHYTLKELGLEEDDND